MCHPIHDEAHTLRLPLSGTFLILFKRIPMEMAPNSHLYKEPQLYKKAFYAIQLCRRQNLCMWPSELTTRPHFGFCIRALTLPSHRRTLNKTFIQMDFTNRAISYMAFRWRCSNCCKCPNQPDCAAFAHKASCNAGTSDFAERILMPALAHSLQHRANIHCHDIN